MSLAEAIHLRVEHAHVTFQKHTTRRVIRLAERYAVHIGHATLNILHDMLISVSPSDPHRSTQSRRCTLPSYRKSVHPFIHPSPLVASALTTTRLQLATLGL